MMRSSGNTFISLSLSLSLSLSTILRVQYCTYSTVETGGIHV